MKCVCQIHCQRLAELFQFTRSVCMVGLFFLAVTCSSLYAEKAATVVTVDVNKILNSLPEAKSRKGELDRISSKAKKEIEQKRSRLQSMEKKLAGVDTASSQAENFRKEAREFERFVRDTEEELKRKFLTTNRTLTEQVLTKIQQYAKSNSIDLVLDKSNSAKGPILFGSPKADITEAIIDSM